MSDKRRKNRHLEPAIGDTKRDIWEVAGWPEQLSFEELFRIYSRSGLAHAVVTLPVKRCWSDFPKIYDFAGEGEPHATNTPFEKWVNYLIENCGFFDALAECDEMQRIGHFAGIAIIAKEAEGTSPSDPLRISGARAIVGYRPCYEGDLEISKLDDNFASPNFGNPVLWTYSPNFTISGRASELNQISINLHHSRLFVFSENSTGNGFYGISPLEVVYNGIHSAQKTIAASSEGFFRNAKQPLAISINNPDAANAAINNPDVKKGINEKLDDFTSDFSKHLMLYGTDIKSIQSTMIDPRSTFDIAVRDIAAGSGIEVTKLIGNEVGNLASEQNLTSFDGNMNSRRENDLTPMIRKFIDLHIAIGAGPGPTYGICVPWKDLIVRSDSEKLDLANKMADVNQKHFNAGGIEPVFAVDEMRKTADYQKLEESDEDFGDDEIS